MTDKPDMTDDWMNPRPSSWSGSIRSPRPDDPTEYLIERERRIICFGSPGSITKWDYWSKYDTPELRDAALKRLREQHPAWHLRARDRHPYREKFYGS